MSAPKYTPEFDAFWKVYPRKTAKVTAFKAWQKQVGDGDLFDDTWKQIVQDCEKRTRLNWWPADKSKVPHGATWINQRRWEDEGWEEDVRTRGREHDDKPAFIPRPPPQEGTIKMTWAEFALGRLFFAYVADAGRPLPDIEPAARIRAELLRDWVPAFQEDIEDGTTTVEAAVQELAKLFLNKMDAAYERGMAERVLGLFNRQRWEAA